VTASREPGDLFPEDLGGLPGALVLGGFAGGAVYMLGAELGWWGWSVWPPAVAVALIFAGGGWAVQRRKPSE
jgi:hypothetical protein